MALRDAQPGQQFRRAERLVDKVIGPVVQRGNLVILAVPHREHQDGGLAPFPQPLQNRHPIHVGQPQIENNRLGAALGGFHQALLAVGRLEDPVAVGFQGHPQQAANLNFIVNNQNVRLVRRVFAHTVASRAGSGLAWSGR